MNICPMFCWALTPVSPVSPLANQRTWRAATFDLVQWNAQIKSDLKVLGQLLS